MPGAPERDRELLYDDNINFQVMGHCPRWQLWKEKQTGCVLKVNSNLKRKKKYNIKTKPQQFGSTLPL